MNQQVAQSNGERSSTLVLAFCGIIFLVGRVFGNQLFPDSWGFSHWEAISTFYVVVWSTVSSLVVWLYWRFGFYIDHLFSKTRYAIIGAHVLLLLLLFFQFDSFLFGAGNERIAQLSQVEVVVLKYQEFGALLVVSWLDSLYKLLEFDQRQSAVYAWKSLAFICSYLSILGAFRLAGQLTVQIVGRCALFIIMFFGPQLLLMFGFVGPEPIIVASTLWFASLCIDIQRQFRLKTLIMLWLLSALAVFMQLSLLMLLPALIYTTLITISRPRKSTHIVAAFFSVITLLTMIVVLYLKAADDFSLQRFLLFFTGKNPHADYGLLSSRHLSDLLQLLLLSFPLVFALKFFGLSNLKKLFSQHDLFSLFLICIGGISLFFLLDPSNSMLLDLPRFIAYLTPGSILLAALLVHHSSKRPPLRQHRLALGRVGYLAAAMSLTFPLAYLPAYLHIDTAEQYASQYLDRHDAYYLNAAISFRDAFFYNRDFEKATWWDQNYIIKSPDYLDLLGTNQVAQGQGEYESIRTLGKLIARNPYWSAPRSLYASIQLKQGQYKLAKPQIDTALMLAPYDKGALTNAYYYNRDMQSYDEAIRIIEKALTYYPNDKEIQVDYMIIQYRAGNGETADSLANELIEKHPDLPYPYLIKGFLLERAGKVDNAIELYLKFVELGENEADRPAIEQRLQKLQGEQ